MIVQQDAPGGLRTSVTQQDGKLGKVKEDVVYLKQKSKTIQDITELIRTGWRQVIFTSYIFHNLLSHMVNTTSQYFRFEHSFGYGLFN